jgi:hypothetical protein
LQRNVPGRAQSQMLFMAESSPITRASRDPASEASTVSGAICDDPHPMEVPITTTV